MGTRNIESVSFSVFPPLPHSDSTGGGFYQQVPHGKKVNFLFGVTQGHACYARLRPEQTHSASQIHAEACRKRSRALATRAACLLSLAVNGAQLDRAM